MTKETHNRATYPIPCINPNCENTTLVGFAARNGKQHCGKCDFLQRQDSRSRYVVILWYMGKKPDVLFNVSEEDLGRTMLEADEMNPEFVEALPRRIFEFCVEDNLRFNPVY